MSLHGDASRVAPSARPARRFDYRNSIIEGTRVGPRSQSGPSAGTQAADGLADGASADGSRGRKGGGLIREVR